MGTPGGFQKLYMYSVNYMCVCVFVFTYIVIVYGSETAQHGYWITRWTIVTDIDENQSPN